MVAFPMIEKRFAKAEGSFGLGSEGRLRIGGESDGVEAGEGVEKKSLTAEDDVCQRHSEHGESEKGLKANSACKRGSTVHCTLRLHS